jgi:hypothetical protein
MTNSMTDDFGEWLRLAEEALSATADDARAGLDPLWQRWRQAASASSPNCVTYSSA